MHQPLPQFLLEQLQDSPLRGGRQDFWLSSRIHPLKAWPGKVFLKREDELSASISGSKWRKINGLASVWTRQGADTLLAWGGSRSQHLLGLAQIGRELALDLRLLVKQGSPRQVHGPDLLWPLLIDPKFVKTLSRLEWLEVEQHVRSWQGSLLAEGRQLFLVREGGAQIEALLGAMTLAVDIVRQEQELGLQFSHIAVDAGTGLTAQALILGLGCLGRYPICEVILCAGSAEEFTHDLSKRQSELGRLLLDETIKPAPYRCHIPATAKSFGSTNRAVFQEIARTAQESGVLLDPIYSAKLFMKARDILPTLPASAALLLIHSGGVQSLFGFPTQLQGLLP